MTGACVRLHMDEDEEACEGRGQEDFSLIA